MEETNNEQTALLKNQLTDITRGLYHAASTTSALLSSQFMYMIKEFFEEQEDGSLVPKTIDIRVSEKENLQVPLISTVNPRALSLDEMKVNLSVKMNEAATRDTKDLYASKLTRSSFQVELSPKGGTGQNRSADIVDMEISFKSLDPPEGFMRLLDSFTQQVAPFKPNSKGNLLPPSPLLPSTVTDWIGLIMKNKKLLDVFDHYGYTADRLQATLELSKLVAKQKSDGQAMRVTTQNQADVFWHQHLVLFKIAQTIFKDNERAVKDLHLEGYLKKKGDAWLVRAATFYEAALRKPNYLTALQEKGYDQEELEKARDEAKALKQQLDEAAKKENSEQATTLDEWAKTFVSIATIVLEDESELLRQLFPDIG